MPLRARGTRQRRRRGLVEDPARDQPGQRIDGGQCAQFRDERVLTLAGNDQQRHGRQDRRDEIAGLDDGDPRGQQREHVDEVAGDRSRTDEDRSGAPQREAGVERRER